MTVDKRRFNGDGDRTAAIAQKFIVEPRKGWVVIRKIFREEKIQSGIVTPAGSRSQRGEVVAAGEDTRLKTGDIVIYTNYPIDVAEDLEELTGEKNLDLVREEEIYALAVPCE